MGALLLVAAAGPQVGELKTFKDWIVGCDNGLACQAAAMMPATGGGATLSVRRAPGGGDAPEVWLRAWEGEAADLTADGKPLKIRLKENDDDAYVVDSADTARLLAALRAAKEVEVINAAGKSVGALSVDGATAALLYMDDSQHRVGTRGALVRRGDKPDSSVPPPPALPVRYTDAGSSRPPAQLPADVIAKARKDADCEDETDPNLVSQDRIDATHTFASVTLMCASGAYNFISANFIIPDGGAPREAQFDDQDEEEGGDLHYNLYWDKETRRLHAGMKGRGIGDCGGRQQYVWDGERFRRVRVEEMDDCRGVIDFITLWRARVIDR
ncbi:MAG TPA: DUF1176 domain-containing protein [Sphingomicrobium sp.]|nr:DUF1176 domain-containing protein [Sphingomicrobium sp.]